jgi:ABC-type dipeptide/oligopeptide/nickel transport system permease subunit
MAASIAYLGFLGLGLKESGSSSRTHPPSCCEWGYSVRKGLKNVVLQVEPRVLGVVGVSGASSYGVLLASA